MSDHTWAVRDETGTPFPRTLYAQFLWNELCGTPTAQGGQGTSRPDTRLPLLSETEALVVSSLLDELQGACGHDDLGVLARTLSVRITDRIGL